MKSKTMLAFLLLSPCLLCGCGQTDNSYYIDHSVDMRVREIGLENTTELEMLDKERSAVVGISVDLGTA